MRGHMRGLQSLPGQQRTDIATTLRGRDAAYPGRATGYLDEAFGEGVNVPEWEADIKRQRKVVSDPLWEKFENTRIIPTPEIEAVIPRLRAAGALTEANRFLAMEGKPATRGFPELTEEVGGNAARAPTEQQHVPTAEAFQYAKEALDDDITSSKKPGARRRLMGIKGDLIDAIDNHPDPEVAGVWKSARDVWAGPTAQLKAEDFGRKVLTDGVSTEEFGSLWNEMSDRNKEGVRIGVRDMLGDHEGKKGTPGRRMANIENIITSPDNQLKVRAMLGDEEAERLFKAFEGERRMRAVGPKIIGGSETAPTEAFKKFWSPPETNLAEKGAAIVGAAGDFVAHPGTTVARMAYRAAGKRFESAAQERAQRINEEAGRILTTAGPERDAILRQMAHNTQGGPGGLANPEMGRQPLARTATARDMTGRPTATEPLGPALAPEAIQCESERKSGPQNITENITQRNLFPAPASEEEKLPPQAQAKPIPGTLPNNVRMFRPEDLKVDAKRFQFKDGGDEAGVTDRLRGVKTWDPIKAGMSLVWEDNAGNHYIVDGHQRHGLATRIAREDPAQDPQILGRVLREADGASDRGARTIAALKNIAEGTGTAVDAAKVLRDNPAAEGQLPPRSDLVRQARGLVNLDDNAFRMVVNDIVPPNFAAIVGHLVPDDPKMQGSLLELLAKTDPANPVQAEAIVRQGINAGTAAKEKSAQGGLFGDEDIATNLYLDRAKVLDKALKDIKRDKTVFSVLSREQEMIAQAGHKLAGDINQKRAASDAQALQVLQTLASRAGPISDALGTAANQARPRQVSTAVRGFVGDIRRMVESGDLASLANSIERGAKHVGNESPAGIIWLAPEKARVTREENAAAGAGRSIRQPIPRAVAERGRSCDQLKTA